MSHSDDYDLYDDYDPLDDDDDEPDEPDWEAEGERHSLEHHGGGACDCPPPAYTPTAIIDEEAPF